MSQQDDPGSKASSRLGAAVHGALLGWHHLLRQFHNLRVLVIGHTGKDQVLQLPVESLPGNLEVLGGLWTAHHYSS